MLGHGPTLMVLSSDLTALAVDLSLSLMLGIAVVWVIYFLPLKHTGLHAIVMFKLIPKSDTLLCKRSCLIQSTIQHLVVVVNSLVL